MRKLLLSTLVLILSAFSASAQTIEFTVESPASIAGAYGFTSTNDVAGWGSPDLIDTANAVMDTLMFVQDTSSGTNPQGNPVSAEGCYPLINDLTGKIAVIYRNTCQFGTKVLMAENAGAIAAIIINREPGLVNMAPGDDGANVTIPAIFIEDATGTVITAEMANGPVVAFIGTRNFDNNLSINPADVLRPEAASTPSTLAMDNTEFEVQVGSWVTNPGNLDGTATLSAKIHASDGTVLYDQSSAATPILAGDSAYFSLPTFSQASYSTGMYNLSYMVDTTGDEFQSDNSVSQDFHISNTKFSSATLDSNENLVLSPFYRPSNATGSVSICTHFRDANASRMAATGISFAAVVSGGSLANRYISTYVHELNDQFTDLNDPNAGVTAINTIGTGEYTYPNDSAYAEIFVPFNDGTNDVHIDLNDDQRYLFCVNTFDTDVYIGFDDKIDYTQNQDNLFVQPISVVENNGSWSLGGFGPEVTSGISVELSTSLSSIGENQSIETIPYPNPANSVINIPLDGFQGNGTISIMDVTGKIIATKSVIANNLLIVDVSDISNGNYMFELLLEDGRSTKFNVVVTK